MVKVILITVLILITGCSANNNISQKQATPKQTRMLAQDHTVAPATDKTQASSTSTSSAGNKSVTIKEAPNGVPSYWLDLIQTPAGTPTNQAPAGTPAPNAPAGSTGQAPQGNANSSQFAQQVLDLVNKERSKAGLSSLSMSGQLSNMAMAKAKDMYDNNYFDHNSPTHGSPFDMMKEFGITYSSAGENIAKGQTSPTQVMNDWMNSPGHRANILNSSYTQIGIAYYNSEWVQEFTG